VVNDVVAQFYPLLGGALFICRAKLESAVHVLREVRAIWRGSIGRKRSDSRESQACGWIGAPVARETVDVYTKELSWK